MDPETGFETARVNLPDDVLGPFYPRALAIDSSALYLALKKRVVILDPRTYAVSGEIKLRRNIDLVQSVKHVYRSGNLLYVIWRPRNADYPNEHILTTVQLP